MNTYDIDGVIYMGPDKDGIYPGEGDVIITGRSHEECDETMDMLEAKGIENPVIYNSKPFAEKTRESSGLHKAKAIKSLQQCGFHIDIHFEDDPIQADIIRAKVPEVAVVLLQHDLVEKENVRHIDT